MKRKINLEEVLDEYLDVEIFRSRFPTTTSEILVAMKEACKQTLELAAENSRTILANDKDGHSQVKVSKQSIINTINQIE